MPAAQLRLNDRHRITLVRVAARLRERGGEIARGIAADIVTELAVIESRAWKQGVEFGDGHLCDLHGRMLRASPEMITFLAELAGLLELAGTVRERLTADPALADLTPLLNEPWHTIGVRHN